MRYALVKDSTVTAIIDWDRVSPYNTDGGVLMECPDWVAVGSTYDGTNWSPDNRDFHAKRRDYYTDWRSQMAMQYKDAADGTTIWKDYVASVKAKFPDQG